LLQVISWFWRLGVKTAMARGYGATASMGFAAESMFFLKTVCHRRFPAVLLAWFRVFLPSDTAFVR
jgi:hypothetical protein